MGQMSQTYMMETSQRSKRMLIPQVKTKGGRRLGFAALRVLSRPTAQGSKLATKGILI